jgi:LacI family transcriptional regulator
MLVSVQRPDMAAAVDEAELHKVLPHELVVRDSTRAR